MTNTDPFELFKLLEPSGAEEQRRSDDDILAFVVEQPLKSPSRRSKRRWWIVGGGIGCVALATAAFAVLRSEPVTEPTAVACMTSPSLSGDVWGLGGVADPIEACAELWTNGSIGSGTVPELTACVNDAGVATVFPAGKNICNQLGLASAETGLSDEHQRVLEMQERVIDTLAAGCFDRNDAAAEVQRILDEFELEDWTVEPGPGFSLDSECAGPGIDTRSRVVFLAGAPRS